MGGFPEKGRSEGPQVASADASPGPGLPAVTPWSASTATVSGLLPQGAHPLVELLAHGVELEHLQRGEHRAQRLLLRLEQLQLPCPELHQPVQQRRGFVFVYAALPYWLAIVNTRLLSNGWPLLYQPKNIFRILRITHVSAFWPGILSPSFFFQ